MPVSRIEAMREAGRQFLGSDRAQVFVDSLVNLVRGADA